MKEEEVLKIPVKRKGEDGYKVFSVRLRNDILSEIDVLSTKSGRRRNELIGMMLRFVLDKCEITE